MRTLLRCLILSLARWGVNMVHLLPSVVAVHLLRLHRRQTVTRFSTARREHYAVLAIYPLAGVNVFVRNLVAGFAENGVGIILVSNVPLNDADREFASRHADVLIERSNQGRDFGAYQAGLRYLAELPPFPGRLFLANDSMFYSRAVGSLVATMLAQAAEFCGAFENFAHYYHVGSFFLAFDSSVAQSGAFRRFWRRYRPYSTRYHCIKAGEAGLTSALMKAGFVPSIVYNTSALRPALLAHAAAGEGLAKTLSALMPESWQEDDGKEVRRAMRAALTDDAMLNAFLRACEKVNQSHALAMCANVVMGAPLLKKDICYRDFWSIATAVHLPAGFDEAEREEMHRALRGRGLADNASVRGRIITRLDL